MSEEMDDRFAHVVTDPRFRTLRKSDKRVKVDKRFDPMFTEKRFRLKYSIDKRGKQTKDTTSEDYHKFYNLSDSEKVSEKESQLKSDEDIKDIEPKTPLKPKIPNARGMDSDVESDGESSSSDSEEDSDESEVFDHKWHEWDKDVPQTERATKRLAICNIDWERINAKDLFVLFNSFKPSGGSVLSVKIFPSELGLQRMKTEAESGPIRLFGKDGQTPQTDSQVNTSEEVNDNEDNEEETEATDSRTVEQLRQYELTRLQYFYAVVECDSEATADYLYTEIDGMEYETSSSTLDLRFIPEDMTFDGEVEPKYECHSMPDLNTYKAPLFINSALQQSRVRMTWDETDPKRKDTFERAFNKEENDDLKAYLASSDSEEDSEAEEELLLTDLNDGSEMKTKDKINKYKELLNSLNETKDKTEDNGEEGMEMEISWEPNLKDMTEDMVSKNEDQKDISVFDKNYIKMKEKRKEKTEKQREDSDSEESNDKHISDIKTNQKTKHKKRDKRRNGSEGPNDPNLELLLMDSSDTSGKKHFNYKHIIENESKDNRKQKTNDSFKFDANDPRFGAVYTSHHYNVDPSDPHFKRTEAFDAIVSRTTKRVKSEDNRSDVNPNTDRQNWTQLVRKVKNKTQMFDNKKDNKFHTKQNRFKS